MDAQPPPLPVWFALAAPDAERAHPAAHRAWRHVPSGAVLVELWFADEGRPGAGVVGFELRHPGGWHERLCVTIPTLHAALWEAEQELDFARAAGWLGADQKTGR
jgi:hypothetical protein